jgi:hypothetical protein
MRRIIWLTALIGALLLGNNAALADGEFYVIVGGGAVGTKITNLPYTINNPGFYFLGGNLAFSTSPTSYNGITINADDVTVDLMGFSLTAQGGTQGNGHGIYMNGRRNVEIRNGTIKDCNRGIFEEAASGANHRIVNVKLFGHTGIILFGKGHLVQNCVASYSGATYGPEGITIFGGTISGCVASKYEVGIRLPGSGSIISNISFNNCIGFGLDRIPGDTDTSPRLIDRNNAYGNTVNNITTNYYGCSATDIWGVNAGR